MDGTSSPHSEVWLAVGLSRTEIEGWFASCLHQSEVWFRIPTMAMGKCVAISVSSRGFQDAGTGNREMVLITFRAVFGALSTAATTDSGRPSSAKGWK